MRGASFLGDGAELAQAAPDRAQMRPRSKSSVVHMSHAGGSKQSACENGDGNRRAEDHVLGASTAGTASLVGCLLHMGDGRGAKFWREDGMRNNEDQ